VSSETADRNQFLSYGIDVNQLVWTEQPDVLRQWQINVRLSGQSRNRKWRPSCEPMNPTAITSAATYNRYWPLSALRGRDSKRILIPMTRRTGN
jgi:hypothetical protein